MSKFKKNNLTMERLPQEFQVARKQFLDLIQTNYGHTPNWPQVRSRILKIFGRDGLEKFFDDSNVLTKNGVQNDFKKEKQ